jgi:hypothetical protein
MLKEFKEFAMRGNVLDMAVGIIIGAASEKLFHRGGRHHHAADRRTGPCGFFQPVH